MSTNLADLPFTPPAIKAVSLPERDIPRETISHTVDPQTTQEYMPPKVQDYIAPSPAPMMMTASKTDYGALMEQLKTPIIVALLFVVFNHSAVQSFLIRVIPSLSDSSNKELMKGGLFGICYYGVQRALEHFNV